MNSVSKQLYPGERFLQAHAQGAERTGRTVNAVRRLVRRCVDLILQWHARRAAIRELQGLNDHYLKDIGLERSQIASAVDAITEKGGHPVSFDARQNQRRA